MTFDLKSFHLLFQLVFQEFLVFLGDDVDGVIEHEDGAGDAFYGLLFLFLAGMMVALPAFLMLSGMEADKLRFWLGAMTLWRLLSLVLGGLLALALAELITYVMEGEGAPKWILQHADKVLFVYAAFSTVVRVCLAASTISHGSRWRSSEIISVAFMLLHAIATPLILVGIGIALRKILPIIQESKTLV